ncbi:DUF397 domain-containing protein [Streptosporangium sp. DT93]|uniref:DUF397 domain-containing protein n=1 Tax=Streptosporangium sp. DT93 TaxID=3393428 RepID=UPI003CF136E4
MAIAGNPAGIAAIRDSKKPSGHTLIFSLGGWRISSTALRSKSSTIWFPGRAK